MDTGNRRKQIIDELMGKTVRVVVDRPIGHQHGDIVYPINYGYIPGIIAEDGEEQDAYILGVTEPISSFEGQVIGAVCRKNDCEDKLIVAPIGAEYHQAEIAEAVHFQEQYFISTVISILRRSCGVIPYRCSGGEREYLILLQNCHAWSFPKGHMDIGETEIQTALRELHEETGLSAVLDSSKKVQLEYHIPPDTRKQLILFPGEVSGDVNLQESEIIDYRWVKANELQNYLHPDTYRACSEIIDT